MNHNYDDEEKNTEPDEEDSEEPRPVDAEVDRRKRVEMLLKEEEEIDKGQPFRTKERKHNNGMTSEGEFHFKKAEEWKEIHRKRMKWKWVLATILILATIILGLFVFYSYPNLFSNIIPNQSTTNYTHGELVDYALTLINLDRSSRGLSNVSLSPIDSGQVHADDMFNHGFFSHWGTDGSKPYMRYTWAGGKGAVEENVAAYLQGSPSDLKTALKDLEFNMMFNDSASNWGHRDNILNSFHNEVSIGVSHGNSQLYFVEDFIDDYINWSTFTFTQNQVTLIGSLTKQVSLSQVNIFYDSLPSNLTAGQLDNSPHIGSYTQGTFTGMALPPNYQSQQGITITAQTWVQSVLTFQIEFDLSQVFNTYGKGVYTLYLQTTSQDSLTSYSIWHE
ncbi:MAG: CAP domain-containing protein [Candidatus Bathyarchaeia archaeon]